MLKEKWRQVKEALEQDVEEGVLAPGDKLPTEPELAARFGVGRHSVRRAIAALAQEGTLSAEQGRGTFVEAAPMIAYAIGKRTRLRQNLAGREISGELLGADVIPARGRVRKALGLSKSDFVIESRRMSLAEGVPIAFGASYHCAQRFPDFVERRAQLGSTTATYASYGIDDYLRAETTVHSRLAKRAEAERLRQHPSMPVMVVRALDTLLDGTPLACSQVIWSASRVKFTFAPEESS